MASKPVIHSVDTGYDIVKEAKAGLSVAAEDPVAIAQAIRCIMALSPAQRNTLGANGRAYILARHDYQHLAQRFLEACQSAEGTTIPTR